MKTVINGIFKNGIHGKVVHGKSGNRVGKKRINVSSEYRAWQNMRQRCNNQKISTWKYYGGRGIKVDNRWNKFENFYADMGDKPTKEHTLERIDTNKNYCKENCKWETHKKQSRNKRNNHHITLNGVTKTMAEWAEIVKPKGISYTTIRARINILGWKPEKALTEKIKK